MTDNATVTFTAGVATKILVETAADGSGTVVGAANVPSGSTVTGYAITRDVNNNFVANVAATWSLMSKAGGVVDGDLVPISGNKSAVFTGHSIGSANIQADSASLSATSSGTLTVIPGSLHHFTFNTISSPQVSTQTFDVTMAAKDVNENTVTGFSGTVDLTTNVGSMTPTISSLFVNGVRTESVVLGSPGLSRTITATKTSGSETGTSNSFNVQALIVATATNGTITPSGNVAVDYSGISNSHILLYRDIMLIVSM